MKSRARTKVGGVANGGGAIRRITGEGIHELVLITLELTTFVSIVYFKEYCTLSHPPSAPRVACGRDEPARGCSDSYSVLQTTSASQGEVGGELQEKDTTTNL